MRRQATLSSNYITPKGKIFLGTKHHMGSYFKRNSEKNVFGHFENTAFKSNYRVRTWPWAEVFIFGKTHLIKGHLHEKASYKKAFGHN